MEDSRGEVGSASHQERQPQQQDRDAAGGSQSPYSPDFYIYSFKVVPCSATYAHNWSLCPFVHPNEKARRRDPRIYTYEPLPCPFDKKGSNCPHGDACTYTHNVYEYWLHPKRFRTQMCQQGAGCKRQLCFFAHNLQELRFAEGQAQPRGSMPASPDPTAALAAAAAAAGMGQEQLQAAGAGPVLLPGPYVPMVPYALMSVGAGAANLPPLQPAGGRLAPAAQSPGFNMAARQQQQQLQQQLQQQQQQQQLQQQQQQQPGWVPGYAIPQGYVVMGSGPGGVTPMMPAPTMMYAGDVASMQQQQQQYLPTAGQWRPRPATPSGGMQMVVPSSAMAAAGGAVRPMQQGGDDAFGGGGLHSESSALDPNLMGSRYQVMPDEQQVLLSQGNIPTDSSSAYLAVQQQQQQHQQQQQQQHHDTVPVSGSGYSGWSLNPAAVGGPSTTSASMSMSVLSMPTVGLSSSASVPGSSNNSLSHIKPGQQGAPVSMDVLQATMQQMSLRHGDCHVRDL